MTNPHSVSFGLEASEADVVEQQTPIEVSDDDIGFESIPVSISRDFDANEADVIEQALAVPEDDAEFDR